MHLWYRRAQEVGQRHSDLPQLGLKEDGGLTGRVAGSMDRLRIEHQRIAGGDVVLRVQVHRLARRTGFGGPRPCPQQMGLAVEQGEGVGARLLPPPERPAGTCP